MLRIAASIAEGVPIDLRQALTGLDSASIGLVAEAVRHTGGHHEAIAAFARVETL